MAKKIIRFTGSPTGKFKLAYSEGEIGEFEEKQADEIIEAGFAVPASDEDVEAYKAQVKREQDANPDAKAKAKADAEAKETAAKATKAAPVAENASDKGAASAEQS